MKSSEQLTSPNQIGQQYKLGPVLLCTGGNAYFYLRFGRYVFSVKNVRRHYRLFSERNGYYPGFRLGRFQFKLTCDRNCKPLKR